MSYINQVQNKILELEGGAFQKLFDEYLYKRFGFNNIQTLGVQLGTNKSKKGVPDSYVQTENGKYILINYGTIQKNYVKKMIADVLSNVNNETIPFGSAQISKIICGHASANITIEDRIQIEEAAKGVEVELIGIDTLSHDLCSRYPHIAKSHLGIAIDTNQFFDVEDFVEEYDSRKLNAPLKCGFHYRDSLFNEICKSIDKNSVTILTGASGVGKTRLALEVCRKKKEEYTVYCILNNGNLLYEDIKYYIDKPGKYLLMLDDANLLERIGDILEQLFLKSKGYKIRILITVRDYASNAVISKVKRIVSPNPNIVRVEIFEKEEIRNILVENLGIKNIDYLDKISEIANGNARLAYLAGINALNKGYPSIRNAEDIFREYYGDVLSDTNLSQSDILVLFMITIAGNVREDKNQFYNDLKYHYGNMFTEKESVEKLYDLELIDWFKHKIKKISDQSLGNYILYRVLWEKKLIDLEEFIDWTFPKYKNKVVYALNTLISIFHSADLMKEVERSIISAWETAPQEQFIEYLESFHLINQEKSLVYIKDYISQQKQNNFDLHLYNLESMDKTNQVTNTIIKVLGGFKYTENFELSIELLLNYFKKRPDLIADIFFVINHNFLFDKDSDKHRYFKETTLLKKIWEATNEGGNYNETILYIKVAEKALELERSFTEYDVNNRTIIYAVLTLGFNNEVKELRNQIWCKLGILKRRKEYREIIKNVALKVYARRLKGADAQYFLKSDFDAIILNYIDEMNIDFYDAKILDKYETSFRQLGMKLGKDIPNPMANPEFKMYKLLSCRENVFSSSSEEAEKCVENIETEISDYNINDYKKMFMLFNSLEREIRKSNCWKIQRGLDTIFELLEKDINRYIEVLSLYFETDTPLGLLGVKQVIFLLNSKGYHETYKLINKFNFSRKVEWLNHIWENINETEITQEIVQDYKKFLISDWESKAECLPSIQRLFIYGSRDSEIKEFVIGKILESSELSEVLLNNVYREEDINLLISIFGENMDNLNLIYLQAIKLNPHIDYNGKIFDKIFLQNPSIWGEYVKAINNNQIHEEYVHNIVNLIWKNKGWRQYIDYAYSVFEKNRMDYFGTLVDLLFAKTEDEEISSRQKRWLSEKLKDTIRDIEQSKRILGIVATVRGDWNLEFILKFLGLNKKIDEFKKINFFSKSESWSGSKIPIILEKIDFLESLKDKLKGIDYIEHKSYVVDLIRSLKKEIEEAELDDYNDGNDDY